MLAEQPFLIGGATWIEVRDGNPTGLAIFDRHYSSQRAHCRKVDQFVGPGGKMVLLTPDARALFVWRKFKSDNGQRGINCAVFRNEGGVRRKAAFSFGRLMSSPGGAGRVSAITPTSTRARCAARTPGTASSWPAGVGAA
jgi:hypothetical protein